MTGKRSVGIIGGMGSLAGAALLQKILSLCPAESDQDYPDIVLHNNSAIPDRTQAIVYKGESPLPELKRSIDLINHYGADIVVLACMTAHYFYDELKPLCQGKLLNAIDVAIDHVSSDIRYCSANRLGIIGSTGLLTSGLFQQRLAERGFQTVVLDNAEQEEYFMKPIYMKGGIKSGSANEKVFRHFRLQVDILKDKGAELVIGACSEVSLVFTMPMAIPVIDAFGVLAEKVVQLYYGKKEHGVLPI